MQIISKSLRFTMALILIGFCMNAQLKAQTPADDPGIGGPGIGAAPAGDGAPVVPFDGEMSLMLLVSGAGYVIMSKKDLFIKV